MNHAAIIPCKMKSVVLLCWIVLVGAIHAGAATLSGTVRDPIGAAIPRSHVVVHWDWSGSSYVKNNIGTKEDTIATTDANGEFSVDLPPGFYDVFISSTAFTPYCEKIRLTGHKSKKLNVKLKLSPVTSGELD
jgi:hypothetical protein